jgi:hypothetical protein
MGGCSKFEAGCWLLVATVVPMIFWSKRFGRWPSMPKYGRLKPPLQLPVSSVQLPARPLPV